MSRRHEQLLFRYSSALARGDFDAVADVLREAERDPTLEQMILEMNDAYAAERFNHNNPKELPMIAALYPPRKQAAVRWQSLPLVAALGVIALLVALLAAQTRTNTDRNSGQAGTPPALAQVNSICSATALNPVNIYSFPAPGSVTLGSIPKDLSVTVLDQRLFIDEQQKATLWYFVTTQAITGWVRSDEFDLRNCPVATALVPTATPTPVLFNAQATALPPTVVPSEGAAVQANLDPTLMTRACKATTLTTADVLSFPAWPSIVRTSVLRNTQVTVGSYTVSSDSQGHGQLWYFVEVDGIQGWMLAYLLDASACPAIPDVLALATLMPTPVPFSAQATALPPTVVPPADAPATTVTCGTEIGEHLLPVSLYSRPGRDALMLAEYGALDPHAVSRLDSAYYAGETWDYVRIDSALGIKEGWITEAQFNMNVTCALINRGEQPTLLPPQPLTATPVPFNREVTALYQTATAMIPEATAAVTATPLLTATPTPAQ